MAWADRFRRLLKSAESGLVGCQPLPGQLAAVAAAII